MGCKISSSCFSRFRRNQRSASPRAPAPQRMRRRWAHAQSRWPPRRAKQNARDSASRTPLHRASPQREMPGARGAARPPMRLPESLGGAPKDQQRIDRRKCAACIRGMNQACDHRQDYEAQDVVYHRSTENDARLVALPASEILQHASRDADTRGSERGADERIGITTGFRARKGPATANFRSP